MATTPHQPPNIWAQMSYTPPRGPCAQRLSMLTTCPCHRFMIHPLKAGSSFECDGCGHHASFHRMGNEAEEAVVRGWRDEMKARGGGDGRVGVQRISDLGDSHGVEERTKKRRMIEGPLPGAWGAGEEDEGDVVDVEVVREVVDKKVVRDLEKRVREREEEKELERDTAREAEVLGRGRKRKGR